MAYRRPVYPRWRGEHTLGTFTPLPIVGLSPLARGTPPLSLYSRSRHRFIPAGAGNTSSACTRRLSTTVYPRWRGEHSTLAQHYGVMFGLSPLARGTRVKRYRLVPKPRFIPAGAGNTMQGFFRFCLCPVYPRWRGEHRRGFHLQSLISGLSPLARGTRL